VCGGQEDAEGVVKERDELDVRRGGFGLEVVFEDDRDVKLGGGEAAQRGGAVDQDVFDHVALAAEERGVACFQSGGEFGGQVDQCGEERPEAYVSGAQAGEVGELGFGKREASDDRVGMLDEQSAGLGRVHALLGAADQLGADAPFEQRDLPRDRWLREPDRVAGGGERAVRDDRAQRCKLAHVEHERSLEPGCRILMSRHGRVGHSSVTMLSARDRSARRSAFIAFFVAGWLPAAWATRVPAIKAELDLSAGALALGILGLETGAIVGLPTGAALVARAGSRRALRIGFAGFAPGLLAVGLASSLAALAAALAAMALANSIVDVAMNAQGVELERRSRRALLSGLHAGHPLGLVAGGLAGTAAAAADLSVGAHFAMAGAVGLALALTSSVWLVTERHRGRQPALIRPSRRLLLLGLLAFCAFGLDGAAYSWSAVDLRAEHDAPAALAAVAFTGFALTLALGRVFGDRLVACFGRIRVVQACAGIAGTGGALIVLAPGAELGLAGWALFGLGLAAVAPTVLGAAPRTGDAPPAVAIAAVTTVGYLGSFTGPPVIGALAEATSLSTALLALVGVSAVLGLLARPALTQRATHCARSGA